MAGSGRPLACRARRLSHFSCWPGGDGVGYVGVEEVCPIQVRPTRIDSVRLDLVRSALLRLASVKSTPERSWPVRSAPLQGPVRSSLRSTRRPPNRPARHRRRPGTGASNQPQRSGQHVGDRVDKAHQPVVGNIEHPPTAADSWFRTCPPPPAPGRRGVTDHSPAAPVPMTAAPTALAAASAGAPRDRSRRRARQRDDGRGATRAGWVLTPAEAGSAAAGNAEGGVRGRRWGGGV